MKAKVLSAILTYANLLLVKGLDFENSSENHPANSRWRILFGKPANLLEFPFLVGMRKGLVTCDGSIIANQWVLSAGHCVYGVQCFIIQIYPAIWQSGEYIKPAECYVHPGYHSDSNAYDISLLRTEMNFLDGGLTKAIPLPAPGTYYPSGTPAVVAGWGETENGIYPNNLLRAEVRVRDWDVCNQKFIDAYYNCESNFYCNDLQAIPRRVLCTQGEGFTPSATCFGDSGGPVMINGVVAGIVSFGIAPDKRCMIGAPSMQVNVVDYLPWIYAFIAPGMDTSGIQVQPETQQ